MTWEELTKNESKRAYFQPLMDAVAQEYKEH